MPTEAALRAANETYWDAFQDDDADARAIYRAQCAYRMRYLHAHVPDLGTRRVLDVGGGHAHVFDCLQRIARDVSYTCVEADARVREEVRRRGIPEVYASIEDVQDKPFGMVILSHVLEHVPDPVGMLRRCVSLLGPDGKVFVEVPNLDDRFKTNLGPHLYVFNGRALRAVCEAAGLVVEDLALFGRADRTEQSVAASDGAEGGEATGIKSWIKRRLPRVVAVRRAVRCAFAETAWGRARLNRRYGFDRALADGRWVRVLAHMPHTPSEMRARTRVAIDR